MSMDPTGPAVERPSCLFRPAHAHVGADAQWPESYRSPRAASTDESWRCPSKCLHGITGRVPRAFDRVSQPDQRVDVAPVQWLLDGPHPPPWPPPGDLREDRTAMDFFATFGPAPTSEYRGRSGRRRPDGI
jgi:hypothetical protein